MRSVSRKSYSRNRNKKSYSKKNRNRSKRMRGGANGETKLGEMPKDHNDFMRHIYMASKINNRSSLDIIGDVVTTYYYPKEINYYQLGKDVTYENLNKYYNKNKNTLCQIFANLVNTDLFPHDHKYRYTYFPLYTKCPVELIQPKK